MQRNIQLHTRTLISTPSEHCRKMPLHELEKTAKLTEHLLVDITMIVATREETLEAISVDEALVTTIVGI